MSGVRTARVFLYQRERGDMITEQQRQRRANGIFASDVARIMTGYGVEVALEKMGEREPMDLDDMPSVQLGNVLEGPVLDAYEAMGTIRLMRSLDTAFHPQHSWLGCHLDALEPFANIVVEAKAYSVFNRGDWGEPGTDEVPLARLWQCMAQMAIYGSPQADIPVCWVHERNLTQFLTKGTVEIETFVVMRHATLIERMVNGCGEVWHRVQQGRLPDPVKLGDARLIYRQDNGSSIEASDDIASLVVERQNFALQEKIAKEAKEELQDRIERYMAESSELTYKGRIMATWKKAKDSEKLDVDRLKLERPNVYAAYLKSQAGSRRFLVK